MVAVVSPYCPRDTDAHPLEQRWQFTEALNRIARFDVDARMVIVASVIDARQPDRVNAESLAAPNIRVQLIADKQHVIFLSDYIAPTQTQRSLLLAFEHPRRPM
jgi:hypothetical protein